LERLDWRPLRGVDQRQLREARLQAHHAVQWLARAARAYVPPQPDDGHTSLVWDEVLNGFVTHSLSDETRISLKITDLTLGLHGPHRLTPVRSLALPGHREEEPRRWLGEQLAARGFDASALDAVSPYQIPAHAIDRGGAYDAIGSAAALAELAAWYSNAQIAFAGVHKQTARLNLAASPICCWPHHFDLATSIRLPLQNTATDGFIGAGFSPADEYYDEPYFYVSIYPEPAPATLPMLPAMGHWHTREFTAGVKLSHKILAAKNRASETRDFLEGTVAIALQILGGTPMQ